MTGCHSTRSPWAIDQVTISSKLQLPAGNQFFMSDSDKLMIPVTMLCIMWRNLSVVTFESTSINLKRSSFCDAAHVTEYQDRTSVGKSQLLGLRIFLIPGLSVTLT